MAMKFEMTGHMAFTYFLNLKELSMVKSALNALEIDYMVFRPNENLERSNILFLPDYLKENVEKICSQNVGCMKIIPSCYKKLFHKDYMGAIYSLGIKHELIGDIVAKENFAYVFYMKSIEEYLKLIGVKDNTIKNIVPNDIKTIIKQSKIKYIFTVGNKAHQLYQKYLLKDTKINDIKLPSTSPANCQKGIDDILFNNYKKIKVLIDNELKI